MSVRFFCESPGIDMDRWYMLRGLDRRFLAWSESLRPTLASVTKLVALDESLTSWEADHIGARPWNWPKPLNIDALLCTTNVTETQRQTTDRLLRTA